MLKPNRCGGVMDVSSERANGIQNLPGRDLLAHPKSRYPAFARSAQAFCAAQTCGLQARRFTSNPGAPA